MCRRDRFNFHEGEPSWRYRAPLAGDRPHWIGPRRLPVLSPAKTESWQPYIQMSRNLHIPITTYFRALSCSALARTLRPTKPNILEFEQILNASPGDLETEAAIALLELRNDADEVAPLVVTTPAALLRAMGLRNIIHIAVKDGWYIVRPCAVCST